MEQTSNNIEVNMGERNIEELVNTSDNTDEQVFTNIDNTTNIVA